MAVISTVVDVLAGQSSNGDIVITPGELVVFSGGMIANTIVADGGLTLISAGGSATGTTAQSGGQQVVEGTAISTLVASGGAEYVASGGVTSGATIFNGGFEVVGNPGIVYGFPDSPYLRGAMSFGGAGSAVGMTVYGGEASINIGGTATGTTVFNSGLLVVNGGTADATSVNSGGELYVGGIVGGTASGTSVGSGGTMNVGAGTADHTSVGSGGTMNVIGATASGVSVGSGGTMNIISNTGGVVSALTIKDPNDPNVTAVANAAGGTVDGSTKIDGGILILDGAFFEPHAALTIRNEGWLLLEQDTFKGTIKDFGGSDELDLAKIRIHRPGAPRNEGLSGILCEVMMMRIEGASHGYRERPTGPASGRPRSKGCIQ